MNSDPVSGDLPIESLRRLARGLLFDRGSADDVVQDAWLAALQRPGEIRGLSGWLAGAVRRLARNRVRADERRDRRERLAARAEAGPSVVEASARIEILQRLLAAVDGLPTPYREAIVLRYFDDLPPREIAQRLGVPVNTARTHVRRGLDRLRAELDPGPGREREALLAALVPFLGPGAGIPTASSSSATTRPSLAQHPILLASSAVALGTLAWVLARPNAPDPNAGPHGPRLAQDSYGNAIDLVEPADARAPQVAGKSAPAQENRSAIASAWTVRGQVTRSAWEAFPSARLVGRVFAGGRAEGTPLSVDHLQANDQGVFLWTPTRPEGLFTLEVRPDQPGVLSESTSRWFLQGDPPPQDWWLDLDALDSSLRGTVRGPDGQPLAAAWVGFTLGDESRAVQSAADGSFVLPWSSSILPRAVGAWKAGFAPGRADVVRPTPGPEHVHEITLQPELRVRGTVRDADGSPLAGAEVTVAEQDISATKSSSHPGGLEVMEVSSRPLLDGAWPSTRTDSQGHYEIGGILAQAEAVLLRASAPGHRSLVVPCEDLSTIAERDWDFALARCVTVTGRVRAAGVPCQAAWVSVGDWPGGATQAWCDVEGRFELPGIATGRQHLWVWRRGFAQLRHDLDVQAGMAGIELELGSSHGVAGLVLRPDGAPAPWAFVDALDAGDAKPPAFAGFQTRTDAEGRFLLADFPAARIALRVSAQGCKPLTQEVGLDRDDLVLRLAAAAPAPVASNAPTPPPASLVPVTLASGNASLRGRLLDLAGNALAGEEIELAALTAERKPSPATQRHAATDAAGEFRFEDLPAGTFDARWVRKEGGQTALDLETRVTLADGEAGAIELQPDGKTTLRGAIEFLTQLPPGYAFDGVPTDLGPPPGGMPPVFPLRLIPFGDGIPGPTGRRGGFAHDGQFELEGLPAGEWIIEAHITFPDGKRARGFTRVTLPASGVAELQLGVLNAL